ncbi:phage major capsid protein [Alicyclobacillus fodiniaquatilis]|uniref:Phage major capsid protein n=1 Tax=Alicyclobacillus fodiniaquatilis TaxID=1661150 RepID=A0ABW4JHZ8_9BACL
MNKLQDLLENRAEAIQKQRAFLDKAKEEERDLTTEEVSAFDALDTEIEGLDADIKAERAKIEREQKVAARENELEKPLNTPFRPSSLETQAKKLDNGGFKNLGEFLDAVRFGDSKGRIEALTKDAQHSNGIPVPEAFHASFMPQYRNEFSVGTGSDGGIMVPGRFDPTIQKLDPESYIVRSRAMEIAAGDPPDGKVTMPALSQGSNGVYGGVQVNWVSEGEGAEDTDAKFGEIELLPQEVNAQMTVTNKLLRNWDAFSSFATNLMQGAIAEAEDIAFLNGSGVGKPLGVVNAKGAISVPRQTANSISYMDTIMMLQGLYPASRSKAVWIASQSIMAQIATLKDEAGNYIYIQGDATRAIPATLAGIPIIFTGKTSTIGNKGDLMLIDFSAYLVKDGSGPFVETSQHVKFAQSKTVIKVTWNVDGQPWLTAPLTLADGATKVSPYVLLDVPSA